MYYIGCEDTSDKNYGVFTSPNYPNVYNTSTQCTYSISLPTKSSITINFDTFELDRSSNDSVSASVNLRYLFFSLPHA